jgi:phosphatidate cytidylyltransferase
MLVRILTGLVGATVYSSIVFLAPQALFAAIVVTFAIIGMDEFFRAVRKHGAEPREILGYAACIAFGYGAWHGGGAGFAGYLPAVLILLLYAGLLVELIKKKPHPAINVGSTLLGAVYIGWLFSYLTLLHGLGGSFLTPLRGTTVGAWVVWFMTAATWLADTGALFTGTILGRHKLAPRISPGKTWEGAIGGLVTSLAAGVGLGLLLHIPLRHALVMAAICGIAGQFGDLAESALKREMGLKDSGRWFPGHGGVLDRIDSLLWSAPLTYYYIVFFVLRHHGM